MAGPVTAPFPYGETVTVERPGAADRYADTQPGTEHTIEGCAFFARYSSELSDGRRTVITGKVVLAPSGSDIRAGDTIRRADGSRWPVEGTPSDEPSPHTGWRPGLRAELKQVAG